MNPSEAAVPRGRVTFLYTDIVDGTAKNRVLGDTTYRSTLLALHDENILPQITKYRGHTFQPKGDGFIAAFQYAQDALQCAVAIQQAFEEKRPTCQDRNGTELSMHIRIGIHTSEADIEPHWDEGRLSYRYLDTSKASRIEGLAGADQIIFSASTYTASQNAADWQTLQWPGRYLKSFTEPEDVYELLWDGKSRGEPGQRFFLSWYFGGSNEYVSREVLEQQVIGLFASEAQKGKPCRLATLRAEGGMGKTRLAIACAVRMVPLFEGNVHFISLAGTSTEEQEQAASPETARIERSRQAVAEAIARGMEIEGTVTPESIKTYLRERGETLLILDNFESVKSEEVSRFLMGLAQQKTYLLVTGREAVEVTDVEQIVPLDDGMTRKEARDLFERRARLKKGPNWQPIPEEIPHIERILTLTSADEDPNRAGPIPLAVELAAAWVGVGGRSLKRIADSLEATPLARETTTPTGAVRSDDEETRRRHSALERSLDWSYRMLGEMAGTAAQRTFAATSLFAASFTAEALAAICDAPEVEVHLDQLCGACLVRPDENRTTGETRYRLHRFTRQYAANRLQQDPKWQQTASNRFVDSYIDFVKQHCLDDLKLSDTEVLALLDKEWRNILESAVEARTNDRLQHECFLRLSIVSFLMRRSMWAVAEESMRDALSASRKLGDQHGEGATLNNLGNVYQNQGRWQEAIEAYQQDLEICRDFGDKHGERATLNNRGNVYRSQGRWQEAIEAFQQSLDIKRALGDKHGEGAMLNNLGNVYQNQGRWQEAIEAFQQSLDICRDLGDKHGEGQTLNNLGNVYRSQGRWQEAIEAYQQDLEICRDLGDKHGEGQTLGNIALLWLAQQLPQNALPFAHDCVAAFAQTEDKQSLEKAKQILHDTERVIAHSQEPESE